jgi:CrcB protein
MNLPAPLLVGIGGALGAVGRQLVSVALTRRDEAVPRGTFAVNVLGSLVLAALTAAEPGGDAVLFVGVGACGAFTTFSSFGVATVDRLERGRWLAAALNALGTLAACLLAVAVGWAVGLAL